MLLGIESDTGEPMQSSTFYSLAFFVGLSSLFSGCCSVPMSGGCGSGESCGVVSRGCDTCPGLLHGGCHGDDEQIVFAELCEIVEETIRLYEQDGRPLPPPVIARQLSAIGEH